VGLGLRVKTISLEMARTLSIGDSRRVESSFPKTTPQYQKAQQDVSNKEIKRKVVEKLTKARNRGYIAPDFV
jgi:hypothetical protein